MKTQCEQEEREHRTVPGSLYNDERYITQLEPWIKSRINTQLKHKNLRFCYEESADFRTSLLRNL